MKKGYLKTRWRKLDNTAKIFSLDSKSNANVFRYSAILKENINKELLKEALEKSLDAYKYFKVKLETGFFWNSFELNEKSPIIEEEQDIPCQYIDFKENNDYLLKITYYRTKINMDIFHVLADGAGAGEFFKYFLCTYLNLKHNLKDEVLKINTSYQDEYLRNYEKGLKIKNTYTPSYQLKNKTLKNTNNTYHYIMNIDEVKKAYKKYNVTMTEYLTAIYIYAIYLSLYDKKSKKEISITLPINLRKIYKVETLSNFFVCTTITPKIVEKKLNRFTEILDEVHREFKEKTSQEDIRSYLTRDVKLGMNIPIRLVPLFIKKIVINMAGSLLSKGSTSTLSNVGTFIIDDKYKKYIDNVLVLVMPNVNQKVKCTICSYQEKLNITINSNIDDIAFEKKFYKLLKKEIKNIKIESNNDLVHLK